MKQIKKHEANTPRDADEKKGNSLNINNLKFKNHGTKE